VVHGPSLAPEGSVVRRFGLDCIGDEDRSWKGDAARIRSEWRTELGAPGPKTTMNLWSWRLDQLPNPQIREIRSPAGLSWRESVSRHETARLRPRLRERKRVAENGGELRKGAERRCWEGLMNDDRRAPPFSAASRCSPTR